MASPSFLCFPQRRGGGCTIKKQGGTPHRQLYSLHPRPGSKWGQAVKAKFWNWSSGQRRNRGQLRNGQRLSTALHAYFIVICGLLMCNQIGLPLDTEGRTSWQWQDALWGVLYKGTCGVTIAPFARVDRPTSSLCCAVMKDILSCSE